MKYTQGCRPRVVARAFGKKELLIIEVSGGCRYLAGKIRSPALDMEFEVPVRHLSSVRFNCGKEMKYVFDEGGSD